MPALFVDLLGTRRDRIAALIGVAALVATLMAGCGARTAGGVQNAAGSDSVQFVPVRRSQDQLDCPPERAARSALPLCRERVRVSARTLRARAAAGEHVLRRGATLTFAYVADSAVTGVELTGGLQYPMSQVLGTHLWVVTLRVRSLDSAVLSYSFAPRGRDYVPPAHIERGEWRGPSAGPPPERADPLRGRLTIDSISSRALRTWRRVLVYSPPEREDESLAGVIYLGDGEALPALASRLEPLIVAGRVPRLLLVGIPSGAPLPSDPPRADPRALEYIWNFDSLNVRFLAHERFVRDEVLPWAEEHHAAPRERSSRAIFGVSNSGAWALDMALRNPEMAAHVIGFSPGGRLGTPVDGARYSPRSRFYLLAGTLEPGFQQVAHAWADSLAARGLEVERVDVVAGHDWQVWAERFGAAVQWAFAHQPIIPPAP